MIESVKNVLIVGGGISGLTAAIALEKAGVKTEIVELKEEWNVYGVGIFQPPNALRALNEVGVAQKCIQQGYSFSGTAFCDANGNQFTAPNNPKIDGYPGLNIISRRTLHEILLEEAETCGANIRMGITVEAIDNQENHVNVKLTDGSTVTVDLVIGADGVHSKVRNLLFGKVEHEYVGQACWRYELPRPKELTNSVLYYGKKAKAGLVPMSEDKMYLLLMSAEPGNPRMPEEQMHELLRDRLQEFGGMVGEARELITDPAAVVYRPIFSFIMPSPWYKGRTLLVGDAAHASTPHLGQGASIAIEDVIVLAELLEKESNVQQVLEKFMERRFERCRLLVDSSHQLVKWELMEWEGQSLEDVNPGRFSHFIFEKMNEAI
jgi:2-polyprenyl-6-methoxyphenol hydroxylase-like FAD-dependent oxidoreductase